MPHAHTSIRILGAATCGGAVGQRAIQQDSVRPVHIGDRDQALVELIVAAVPDDAVDIIRAVVVVAPTLLELVAAALDGLGLVLVRGRVVVGPGRRVRVEVDRVVPQAGPKGERRAGKDEGDRGDAAGGARAGAVGYGRPAAVESSAAVRGGRAGAGGCPAA